MLFTIEDVSMFDVDGNPLTVEQREQIAERRNDKAEALADMRRQRESMYALKDSHIGVEIGRDLIDPELLSQGYGALQLMATWAIEAGKAEAGRTFLSLAGGILRFANEAYGAGGVKEIEEAATNAIASLGYETVTAPADYMTAQAAPADTGPVSALEPAPSPEPEETPQMKAARERRQRRQAAKMAQQG